MRRRCRSCRRVQRGGRRTTVASLAGIARRRTLPFRLCDVRWLIAPALRHRATAERSSCPDWNYPTRRARGRWRYRLPAGVARRISGVRGQYRYGRGLADIGKVSSSKGAIVSGQASSSERIARAGGHIPIGFLRRRFGIDERRRFALVALKCRRRAALHDGARCLAAFASRRWSPLRVSDTVQLSSLECQAGNGVPRLRNCASTTGVACDARDDTHTSDSVILKYLIVPTNRTILHTNFSSITDLQVDIAALARRIADCSLGGRDEWH